MGYRKFHWRFAHFYQLFTCFFIENICKTLALTGTFKYKVIKTPRGLDLFAWLYLPYVHSFQWSDSYSDVPLHKKEVLSLHSLNTTIVIYFNAECMRKFTKRMATTSLTLVPVCPYGAPWNAAIMWNWASFLFSKNLCDIFFFCSRLKVFYDEFFAAVYWSELQKINVWTIYDHHELFR